MATRNQDEYQLICQQVLERDNWRCQHCGSMLNLQVHHQQFRSHSGPDVLGNLVVLCFKCHREQHGEG